MNKRVYEGKATGVYEPLKFLSFMYSDVPNATKVVTCHDHPRQVEVFHTGEVTVLYEISHQSLPYEKVIVTLHGQPKKIETLEAKIKKEDASIRRKTNK